MAALHGKNCHISLRQSRPQAEGVSPLHVLSKTPSFPLILPRIADLVQLLVEKRRTRMACVCNSRVAVTEVLVEEDDPVFPVSDMENPAKGTQRTSR